MQDETGDLDFSRLPSGPGMLRMLVTGFGWSAVLWTGIELGVFDALVQPSDAAGLAARLRVPPEALQRLLGALVAIGLVDAQAGDAAPVYRLSPLAEATLTSDAPHSIAPLVIQNQRHFFEMFMHLPEAVRTGGPPLSRWRLHRAGATTCYESLLAQPEEYARLLAATDSASGGVAEVIAECRDLSAVRHLVDLGHGGGRLARDLLGLMPELRVTAVDLEPAIAYASERAAAAGLQSRMHFVAADLRDPLPAIGRADAVLLSGVVSDFPADDRARVLEAAFAVLRPGGIVLISETLLDDDRHGPPMPALLSLCMLLLTGGDNFTGREVTQMLIAAGFEDAQVYDNRDRGVRDLVVARRP